jgi:hypothetical protein
VDLGGRDETHRRWLAHVKNKIGTYSFPSDPPPGCGYFLEEERRFCDAPALPGSSYCSAHRRLCQVRPGTAAAARVMQGFENAARSSGPLPPELAFLASIEPPELDSADEPRDLAGCIDLATPADGGAE